MKYKNFCPSVQDIMLPSYPGLPLTNIKINQDFLKILFWKTALGFQNAPKRGAGNSCNI